MIVYFNERELAQLRNSLATCLEGYSYTWEGEDVIHLFYEPVKHAYGREGRVLFIKMEIDDEYSKKYDFIVLLDNDNIQIFSSSSNSFLDCKIRLIPSEKEMYSRSKGLLEVSILKKKRILIIGLGSFGSQIAIEMAKAGVGAFSLIDFDRVEPHNLARHTATINDLGRLKTNVIKDAILGKNPYAEIEIFSIDINNNISLLESEVAKSDIVICATDNNYSRFNISKVLVGQKKIGVFGRAVTRAEGGDVFVYRPGGPCYCCLLGNSSIANIQEEITDEESARRNGQIPAYVSSEDADAMIQVGLSSDIAPICNLMEKIALMELSRGLQSGITQLEEDLVYEYYIWANRREKRHENWFPMPNAGSKPTIMRWYGAHICKNDYCTICSEGDIVVDSENNVEGL